MPLEVCDFLRPELCPRRTEAVQSGQSRRSRPQRGRWRQRAAEPVRGMHAGYVHERHGRLESVSGRHEDECHMDAVARARDLHVGGGDGHRGARELNRHPAASPRHPEPPPQHEEVDTLQTSRWGKILR